MKITSIQYVKSVIGPELGLHDTAIKGHIVNNNRMYWHGLMKRHDNSYNRHWYFNKRIGYSTLNDLQTIFKNNSVFGEVIEFNRSNIH